MGDILIRRREMIQSSGGHWRTVLHNSFNTYYEAIGSNGNRFTAEDGGEYAQCISNGKNQNTTGFFSPNPKFVYNDYKDLLCRFSWVIEDSGFVMDGTVSSGNIGFGMFATQNPTNWNNYTRRNIATYVDFLGSHSVEFVPSEFLDGISPVRPYLGWHIGFRSNTEGDTIWIRKIDFEVWEE